MEKVICSDKNEASLACARELNVLLKVSKPLLLLLSGGSALDILQFIDHGNLDKQLTISVLDERYSKDPKVNHFLQLKKTKFYKKANRAGCIFFSTEVLDEPLIKLASKFEYALRTWKKQHPEGKVIVIQGIGSDGHTAGIMPYPDDKARFDKLFLQNWVVGYDAGSKNQYPQRITVTLKFLQEMVYKSLVYAVGEEKQGILEKIFKGNLSLNILPASVINSMKNVSLFTDVDI